MSRVEGKRVKGNFITADSPLTSWTLTALSASRSSESRLSVTEQNTRIMWQHGACSQTRTVITVYLRFPSEIFFKDWNFARNSLNVWAIRLLHLSLEFFCRFWINCLKHSSSPEAAHEFTRRSVSFDFISRIFATIFDIHLVHIPSYSVCMLEFRNSSIIFKIFGKTRDMTLISNFAAKSTLARSLIGNLRIELREESP